MSSSFTPRVSEPSTYRFVEMFTNGAANEDIIGKYLEIQNFELGADAVDSLSGYSRLPVASRAHIDNWLAKAFHELAKSGQSDKVAFFSALATENPGYREHLFTLTDKSGDRRKEGNIPLHTAVNELQSGMVSALLSAVETLGLDVKAYVNIENARGERAIDWADKSKIDFGENPNKLMHIINALEGTSLSYPRIAEGIATLRQTLGAQLLAAGSEPAKTAKEGPFAAAESARPAPGTLRALH